MLPGLRSRFVLARLSQVSDSGFEDLAIVTAAVANGFASCRTVYYISNHIFSGPAS